MYGTESSFWLSLIFILAVFIGLFILLNAILRKLLGIEKQKTFSHNHINDLHKKIDWSIRIFFILLMIIGYFINVERLPLEPYLLLETWFLLIALVIVTEIIRAVMERKYAKNPNAYIYNISQLAFIVVFSIIIFTTDFFDLF